MDSVKPSFKREEGMKYIKLIGAMVIAAIITACGPSLEGSYSCDGVLNLQLDFKSNGSGYASSNGEKHAFEYKIDGDNVIMTTGTNSNVMTLKEGNLLGNKTMIGTCTKK